MLLVTVELLPFGSIERRKTIGQARIINLFGDAAYGSYRIELSEGEGKPVASGQLSDYPRFAGTVFDLVARGIIVALAGREEMPPRPTHPWRED